MTLPEAARICPTLPWRTYPVSVTRPLLLAGCVNGKSASVGGSKKRLLLLAKEDNRTRIHMYALRVSGVTSARSHHGHRVLTKRAS